MSDAGVSPDVDQPDPPPRSRVAVYYAGLILLTAAVVVIVILAGRGKHGQTSVAGGYDVSAGAACLGAKADLTQSGEFVSISNTKGTLSGDLTLKRGVLSGTVHCVNHASALIAARFSAGLLTGGIGGQTLSAEQKRDAPAAGAPTPQVPGSVAGVYSLAPSSTCLGSSFTLAGSGSHYTLTSANKKRGTLTYEAPPAR